MSNSGDSTFVDCRFCLFGKRLLGPGCDRGQGEEFDNPNYDHNYHCGLCNRFPSH